MAFPTTGILDALNVGPTEDPLSHGGNWGDLNNGLDIRLNTDGVDFFAQGQNNSSTPSTRYWAASTYGPDTEAYITCTVLPGGSNYIRLYIRIQSVGTAGQTSYMMQWSNDTNGCRIFRETSQGTFSQLAKNGSATFAVSDQIGFEAVGTALTAYKNGTSVLTTTDSNIALGGNIALAIRDSTGRLQQFGGGTVVTATNRPKKLMTLGVG